MRFYLRIFSNRRYEGACLYVGEYSRYTVFEVSNERTFNKIAFKTNSRSKLKIWLDLNLLKISKKHTLKDHLRILDRPNTMFVDATIPLEHGELKDERNG